MLKKLTKLTLLSVILLIGGNKVFAQQKMSEGQIMISYKLNAFSDKNKEDYKLTFKDKYCKITMLGGSPNADTTTVTIISDITKEEILMLTETAGIKVAITVDTHQELKDLAKQKASPTLKAKMEALASLSKEFTEFSPTGKKQQIDGYQAEEYQAKLPNGKTITLWTTKDIVLPVDLSKYFIGALAGLLEGKKINGTPISLLYGDQLDVKLKFTAQKVEPISMEVPADYMVFALGEILQGSN